MTSRAPSLVSAPDPAAVLALVRRWLVERLAPEASRWLVAEVERQLEAADERRLAAALGLAARKLRRERLGLDSQATAEARALRAGWQPELWSADEAARVALLLAAHRGPEQAFAERIERLCRTAEMSELVACLKGFAVFPGPRLLEPRAREAVRSAIQPVFEAIACYNPYPADFFDEAAWNQMVVKCVFAGTPIRSVTGLARRRNADLLRMLRDLVAERRAAGRAVAEDVLEFVA